MILFIDGISQGVHCPNVGFGVEDYESAFELLTQLVADEWTLLQATLIDGEERLRIPVEAFDGQPIQIHIQALQNQWNQLLLISPVRAGTLGQRQLKDWYLQLDAYYEELLNHLEKMIFLLETRQSEARSSYTNTLTQYLMDQRDLRLKQNRILYQQTKGNQQLNRQRLHRFR